MKQLLLVFFCMALFIGKAQNGFTTYTSNISITGLIKTQTALLNDNAGNEWIGFRTITTANFQGNAGLMKYEKAIGNWTLYNRSSSPSFPSNNVTCLAQTANGDIWIGTDSALFRFDGTIFTKYTVNEGLPGNSIKRIAAIGNFLAISTPANGLSIFDGVSFNNYSVSSGTLPTDSISAIGVEGNNMLWLGSGKKLIKFSINGSLTNTSFTTFTMNGTPDISCIYVDGQNSKWIGTVNKGLFKFDGAQFYDAENLYSLPGDIPNSISDIAQGLHNGVVVKYRIYHDGSPYTYGLVELTANGQFYPYLKSSTTFTNEIFGCIEGDGNEIYYTMIQGPIMFNYQFPSMFGSFGDSAYVPPIGTINHTNYKTLDINQVSATIGSWGSMHGFGDEGQGYQVPKNSGNHTIGNTSLWIGGLNQNNQLCGAGQVQYSRDFWPGPIDTVNVSTDSSTSNSHNKVWKVSNTEVDDFVLNFNNGNIQNGTYTIPSDMLTWPAHGQGNYSRNLAPFIDHNGDGFYNPYDGDYPEIKGDQTIYSIYNDILAPHSSSFTPMGIEVHLMAYAYGCPSILNGRNELAYTTFYNYKIVNRSLNNYHDVFLGLYNHQGTYYNAIGCNVAQNYSYLYGHNYFNNWNMPAQGIVILDSPLAQQSDGIDNNNDGLIDEMNEECKLTSFSRSSNGGGNPDMQKSDPHFSQEYYNRLKGKWNDGAPILCQWGSVSDSTKWMFSGDPTISGMDTDPNGTCGYWLDGGSVGQANGIMGSGPFNFTAGEIKEIEYAYVTSFDSSGTTNSNLLAVSKLKIDIQKVRTFYELQNKPNCNLSMNVGIEEESKEDDFIIYPNPTNDYINVRKAVIDGKVELTYELMDVLGKPILSGENKSGEFSIKVQNLDPGVYFLSLNIDDNFVVKKIIKE